MVSNPTFAAARAAFLRDGRQRNLSPRTLESYDQILARIGQELPSDGPLGAFDLELCRAWLDERADLRPATRANYTRTMKVFGHWCAIEYSIADPLDRLRVPQIPMPEIVPFGDDHLERLFASAAPYLAYAFVLLLETGLRSSEATALDLVDMTAERVLVRHPKGLRERVVPTSPALWSATTRYLAEVRPALVRRSAERRLLIGARGRPLSRHALRSAVAVAGRRAGINDVRVSPHTFRHTFAADFAMSGGQLFVLQAILGHSTLDMVRRYARPRLADLRREMDLHSPLALRRIEPQ